MANAPQAKVITPREIPKLRYTLPPSWRRAAGMLKGKKRLDPLRYQRQIRQEWEERLEKLAGLMNPRGRS